MSKSITPSSADIVTIVRRDYGLHVVQSVLLQHDRHYIFKLLCRNHRARERYVLRIYRDESVNARFIRSQFRWLGAILRDTEMIVPEPIANRTGGYLTKLRVKNLPALTHCTVTRWVPGKNIYRSAGPGVNALRKVGRLMAQLHSHGQKFAGIQCPQWDWEGLFGESSPWRPRQKPRVNLRMNRFFDRVMLAARRAMQELGTGSNVFGLIHGDLMQANYVFHRGIARAIDFGDFGRGYFLYDMAVTLLMLRPFDRHGRQRAAFIRGYREIRPLTVEHEALLDTFIANRAVVLARWISGSSKPDKQELKWVVDTMAWLKESL